MRQTSLIAAVGLILLGTTIPTLAHHAFAPEFDKDKPVTVHGQISGSCLTASLSVRRPYQAFRRSTRGRSVNFAMHS